MQHRPYKLLNASERAFLAKEIDHAARQWLSDWSRQLDVRVVARCVPADELRSAAMAAQGWAAGGDDGHATHVADPDALLALVKRLLAGVETSGDEGAIASELARQALDELLRRLTGSTVKQGAAPVPEHWERGSGAACVVLQMGAEEIFALLDPLRVEGLLRHLPAPRHTEAPLTDPRTCIGRTPVEVGVWLGSAELDLAQFQSLAVNDVIQLDGRIDEPLRLAIGGRPTALARAFLGQRNEQKAVRLTSYLPHH
jgi:flagellar motor switch/type III secretory pathway protein FliN